MRRYGKKFDGCKNVTLFDVNEYITSDDDFNDSVNHYKKRVYYLMAQKFTEMINAHANANVAKQTSKAKLAYLTLKQKIKKIVKPNGKFYIDQNSCIRIKLNC